MGNLCAKCFGKRKNLKRWLRSERSGHGDHSNEFSNLIDEGDTMPSKPMPSLTESEVRMLKDRKYDSLIEEQKKLELQAAGELAQQEAALQEAEELSQRTRRDAALAARTRKLWSEEAHGDWRVEADRTWTSFTDDSSDEVEFGEFLNSVKVSRLHAESAAIQTSTDVVEFSAEPRGMVESPDIHAPKDATASDTAHDCVETCPPDVAIQHVDSQHVDSEHMDPEHVDPEHVDLEQVDLQSVAAKTSESLEVADCATASEVYC